MNRFEEDVAFVAISLSGIGPKKQHHFFDHENEVLFVKIGNPSPGASPIITYPPADLDNELFNIAYAITDYASFGFNIIIRQGGADDFSVANPDLAQYDSPYYYVPATVGKVYDAVAAVFAGYTAITHAPNIIRGIKGLGDDLVGLFGKKGLTARRTVFEGLNDSQIAKIQAALDNAGLGDADVLIKGAEMPDGYFGMTLGDEGFVINPSIIDDAEELGNTLVHELQHVLDRRKLGNPSAYGNVLEEAARAAEKNR